MTHPGAWREIRWFYWLVAIPLLATYWPAIQGEFLMSDLRAVVHNPSLVGLEGLASLWTLSAGSDLPPMDQYQPLTYTLWWLERSLWGLDPRPYQYLSIALHAANSVLVWGLLTRIGARGAFLSAAIFALHPVQVESVAWIYEQKNPLSGLFFFLSLHAYLRFYQSGRRAMYAGALVCFAASMLVKASTVVLPGVLVLYLWFRGDALRWKTLVPTLPFFALAALMALVTISYETLVTGASADLFPAGPAERLVRAGWLVGFNAGKIVFPSGLAFFYPLWSVDPADWRAHLPNLLILVLTGCLWLRRTDWGRPALLGLGWYLGLLFPVAGFFDIYYHRFSLLADHFQYLPMVGLVAWLIHSAVIAMEGLGVAWVGRRRGLPSVTAAVVVIAVVGGLGSLTWQRSHVFANDGLLARDAADQYPTSWLAFQKSGEYLLTQVKDRRGDPAPLLQQALADLEHAVQLKPDHAQVNDSLGVAHSLVGNWQKARHHLEIAVELDPTNVDSLFNLGRVYDQLGELEPLLATYRTMVGLEPDRPKSHFRLARALVRARRFNEGLSALESTIELARPLATSNRAMAELLRRAEQSRAEVRAQLVE